MTQLIVTLHSARFGTNSRWPHVLYLTFQLHISLNEASMPASKIAKILRDNESELLDVWVAEQKSLGATKGRLSEVDLRDQSRQFLQLLQQAGTEGDVAHPDSPAFDSLRRFLSEISATRA